MESSAAIEGPIPSQPMLEKRVVFLPLILGTLKNALLSRGKYVYNGASEVWAPVSSTNTTCLWSSASTVERQTNLSHSTRSLRPIFFRLCPRRLIARQIVASLTLTPQIAERNSPHC